MSFLLTLDNAKLDELIPYLGAYETLIVDAEPIFKLENRRIEEIIRVLPHHQSRYDQALQELKALEEWLNNHKEKETGRFWKKYLEGYPRQLATRDIQAYIAAEKEIVELNQVLIEVTLLKSKMAAIVEALKQMGWMMGHVTKLRVSEIEDAIF